LQKIKNGSRFLDKKGGILLSSGVSKELPPYNCTHRMGVAETGSAFSGAWNL
jgi:hypothetical protein